MVEPVLKIYATLHSSLDPCAESAKQSGSMCRECKAVWIHVQRENWTQFYWIVFVRELDLEGLDKFWLYNGGGGDCRFKKYKLLKKFFNY